MNLTRWRSPTSPGGSPSSESQLEFRYSNLKSTKTGIRLARIRPGSGNKGIAIDLFDAFIATPGQRPQREYDALSYTWGDSRRTKNILCNGRRLAVTATLLEALHHFRDSDKEVVLWIDQICICQDRIIERNQQVDLMGKIFAGARKVYVWLGPHSDDSRAGLQLAKQLLSICRYEQNVCSLDHSQLEIHGLPRRGHRRWKALSAILRRPWFWRTWIVQEVVLNQTVELVLGDCTLTWEDLEAIVDLVEGPVPRQWHVDPTMSAWELPFSRINRIRLRHQKRRGERPLSPATTPTYHEDLVDEPSSFSDDVSDDDELDLLDLLLMSRDLQASEPLDKIYALLGLGRHEIVPDYTSTPETVFSDFALHIVGEVTKKSSFSSTSDWKPSASDREVRKALILLSCAGLPNQNLRDLPSWVPDWTANLSSRPLIFTQGFNAGGDVMERFDWHYDTGLQLYGRLVDTVVVAGTTRLTYDEDGDATAGVHAWWNETSRMAASRAVRSPGSTANVDAFSSLCRILRLDENGYYNADKHTKRRESLLAESSLSPSLSSSTASLASDIEHQRAQQTIMLGPTRGRVLFVTTTGYIGLAPFGTQEGDLLYVVLGSPVPYVLRPRTDGSSAFALVGEAYVQGIMNGEALEMEWLGIEDIYIR